MKKIYYLTLLVGLAAISCKKDETVIADKKNDKQTNSVNSYYPIGTEIPLSKAMVFPEDIEKLFESTKKESYTSIPGSAGTWKEVAGGSYNRGTTVATSANNIYSLYYQSDGNLVLEKGSLVTWASNAIDNSAVIFPISQPKVNFQTDGNIVCTRSNGNVYWAANVNGSPKPIWILQDDGNFVGYKNYAISTTIANYIIILDGPFGSTDTQYSGVSTYFGTVRHH